MKSKAFSLQKLVSAAVFTAMGVLLSPLLYVPVGPVKAFPVQHMINVLLAVLLGWRYGIGTAFSISTIRIVMSSGSILAYPGSMIGAALAGYVYKKTGNVLAAAAGEVIGTGIIGALAAYPLASVFLGTQAGAFFLVLPFAASSAVGALCAWLLCQVLPMPRLREIAERERG